MIDWGIIGIALVIYLNTKECSIKEVKVRFRIEKQEQMPRRNLMDPILLKSDPLEEDFKVPVRFSKSKSFRIDHSLPISDTLVPKYSKKTDNNISVSPSRRSPVRMPDLNSLKIDQDQRSLKYLQDRESHLNSLDGRNSMDFYQKYMPTIDKLMEGIYQYYNQLATQQEEIKAKPKIPGSRTRIIIEPYSEDYQNTISEKIKLYKEKLEESNKKIESNLKVDLKAIVSQITSDLDDKAHLNDRINAALNLLKGLTGDNLTHAIYIICEEVVQRGQDQCDSIDVGPNFAINFTNFILTIAKSYHFIHEIYFIAVIKIKYSYFPKVLIEDKDSIGARNELKDIGPQGRLGELEKERLVRQMDRARAYAFLLGSLFASKESNFNEGDIWRWISFVSNITDEYIDRSHLSIMFGFLKTTGPRLRESYKAQYTKLVELLKGPYLENLNKKFGKNPYLKAYITQLREVMTKL